MDPGKLAATHIIGIALALAAVHAGAAPMDIHAAVRSGDVATVQAALKSGAGPDAPDSWGRTPLIVALQQGKGPVAETLLDAGANVAATDAWGRTPLLVATQMKNTAAIGWLLRKGSDVNAANRNDITPLIAAAQTGNREAARLLLEAGAAPDRVDNLGMTALMWAEKRRDDAIVKMLRERGAASPAAAPKPAPSAARRGLSPAFDSRRIVRGDARAAITLFEYTDFQCPYCAQGARTVNEVMARYEGQVRLVVKHLPLPLLHPMALPAARYFEAIAMQSAEGAWAFYDRIFADQAVLAGGEPGLRTLAAALGVDMQGLDRDLASPAVQDRIAADLAESQRFRFDGVPAFIIEGEAIEGAQPAQRFFDVIDAAARR